MIWRIESDGALCHQARRGGRGSGVHAGLRAYNRTFAPDTADPPWWWEDGAGQIIWRPQCLLRKGEAGPADVLWVAESCRGTGLGACLPAQLEQDAARQGAKRLELNTLIPGPRLL